MLDRIPESRGPLRGGFRCLGSPTARPRELTQHAARTPDPAPRRVDEESGCR
jgi:hypothetical protein